MAKGSKKSKYDSSSEPSADEQNGTLPKNGFNVDQDGALKSPDAIAGTEYGRNIADPPSSVRRNGKYRRKALPFKSDPSTRVLQSQLAKLGLALKDMSADGNCLFRSLADQIEGNPGYHSQVRQVVCRYQAQHRDEFEPFLLEFEDAETFDQHLKRMQQSGTFGGHLEIVACARAYNVDVAIHQDCLPAFIVSGLSDELDEEMERQRRLDHGKDPDTYSDDIQFKDSDETSTSWKRIMRRRRNCIHLAYHDWEHYSSVRNIDGPFDGPPKIKLRPPPPPGGKWEDPRKFTVRAKTLIRSLTSPSIVPVHSTTPPTSPFAKAESNAPDAPVTDSEQIAGAEDSSPSESNASALSINLAAIPTGTGSKPSELSKRFEGAQNGTPIVDHRMSTALSPPNPGVGRPISIAASSCSGRSRRQSSSRQHSPKDSAVFTSTPDEKTLPAVAMSAISSGMTKLDLGFGNYDPLDADSMDAADLPPSSYDSLNVKVNGKKLSRDEEMEQRRLKIESKRLKKMEKEQKRTRTRVFKSRERELSTAGIGEGGAMGDVTVI